MSHTSAGQPGRYQIRLKGHLGARWATWFDGMTLTSQSDGTTLIDGPVIDQAALHGLLRTLRDTGLPLLSVAHVEASQDEASQDEPSQDDTTRARRPATER